VCFTSLKGKTRGSIEGKQSFDKQHFKIDIDAVKRMFFY
jgi:hypothetical protein